METENEKRIIKTMVSTFRKMSQEKFALTIGMDRTYYSSVESGKRNISLLNIKKLADGFGIPVADLFPKNMLDEEEDYD